MLLFLLYRTCWESCEKMKKMILVDPIIYQNTAQKEITKLDEEISQILKSDLQKSDKIKQYNQTL